MRNLWQNTEMPVAQAYREYEEAIAEVQGIIGRDPRGARHVTREVEETREAREKAGEELILLRVKTAIRDKMPLFQRRRKVLEMITGGDAGDSSG